MTTLLNTPVWTAAANNGKRTSATLLGVGEQVDGRRSAVVQVGVTDAGYMLAWRWNAQSPWVKVAGKAAGVENAKSQLETVGFQQMATAINETMRLRGDDARDGGKLGELTSVAWSH